MIKRYLISLVKKWIYQDYKSKVLDVAKWENSDTKELKDFLESETGTKLMLILNNNEAHEAYASFNEKVNSDWRRGRVSGVASVRTTIMGLAHEKKEAVEAELSVQELDEMINDRLTGYFGRKYEF